MGGSGRRVNIIRETEARGLPFPIFFVVVVSAASEGRTSSLTKSVSSVVFLVKAGVTQGLPAVVTFMSLPSGCFL